MRQVRGRPPRGPPYPPSCTWSRARPELKPSELPIPGRKQGHQRESRVVSAPSSWEEEEVKRTEITGEAGSNAGCLGLTLRTSAERGSEQGRWEQRK